MATWVASVLVVTAPWLKSMIVLAVVRLGSASYRGLLRVVPARCTLTLEPANLRRVDL
jgi:hypothetical protein